MRIGNTYMYAIIPYIPEISSRGTLSVTRQASGLTTDGREHWRAILGWTDNDGAHMPLFDIVVRSGVGAMESADKMAATALTFIAMCEGDTDSDYFDDYTDAQLEWRDMHAESVSALRYADEDHDGENLAHLRINAL